MRILYGIQGTGNGHLTRAMEILPALYKRGEVDVLVSGVHSELGLPVTPTYTMHGLGFVFGKNGGIDLLETYRKSRLKKFYREVRDLDVSSYDLILSDFEPVSAWAAMRQGKLAVGLSNQVSLLNDRVPTANNEDVVGRFILRHYAPTPLHIGLSYKAYDEHIYTPIIRKSLRQAKITQGDHYVVYLPSYSDQKLLKVLRQFPKENFHVFSKHTKHRYAEGKVDVHPLNKESFEALVTSSKGIISAAGFGTSTEALFMGKKLLVVPQKQQYEQACNAKALKGLGAGVVKSFKKKHLEKIEAWLAQDDAMVMDYPDQVEEMLDDAMIQLHSADDPFLDYIERDQYLLKTA